MKKPITLNFQPDSELASVKSVMVVNELIEKKKKIIS